MLRTAVLALTVLTGACGPGDSLREADHTSSGEAPQVVEVKTRGRVIDLAVVFTPDHERRMAADLTTAEQRTGRKVMLVTVSPTAGDSMERIGWAVRGAEKQSPILLLIDPNTQAVRIEGDLPPERKAALAGAVRGGLAAGNLPTILPRALAMLEQRS